MALLVLTEMYVYMLLSALNSLIRTPQTSFLKKIFSFSYPIENLKKKMFQTKLEKYIIDNAK